MTCNKARGNMLDFEVSKKPLGITFCSKPMLMHLDPGFSFCSRFVLIVDFYFVAIQGKARGLY